MLGDPARDVFGLTNIGLTCRTTEAVDVGHGLRHVELNVFSFALNENRHFVCFDLIYHRKRYFFSLKLIVFR